MDLFSIGTAYASVKTLRLQSKWDQKRASGDVTAHDDPMKKTQAAAAWQQIVDDQKEDVDDRLKKISEKALSGKKLTPSEREYLKAKDPELYQKIVLVEEDAKSYEREIRRCRTKEDVQRLKMARLSTSMQRIKAVENDPAIPTEKKLEACRLEDLRCGKFRDIERTFVEKGEYAKLPTEAEEAKARKEAADAEEARRKDPTGKDDPTDPAAKDDPADPVEEGTVDRDSVRETEGVADKEATGSASGKRMRAVLPGKDVSAVPRPGESQETKKVRRARSRAAWGAAAYTDTASASETDGARIDRKA